jgi:surface antigen
MKTKIAAVAMTALVLAGCAADSGAKQNVGTVAGAIGGAALGSQFGRGTGNVAAIAAGTLLGAFLGSEVGKSLDAADRAAADRAQSRAYAAPVGERITWNNPNSGNSGTIVPTREGTSSSGAYCREFQNTIIVGGKTEQAYGTACRQPDGSWKVVQ